MEKRLRDVWLLNFSTFFFLGISVVNPIISPFAITLHATPFMVGLVAGVASVVSLLSKPVGGLIWDRGYRFHALFFGNLLGTLAGLLYVVSAVTGNLTLFAFSRGIHGFAMGIFFPSSLSTAVDLAPPGRVGETLGWRGMMFSLGNIIGPPLEATSPTSLGLRGPSHSLSCSPWWARLSSFRSGGLRRASPLTAPRRRRTTGSFSV